MSAEKVESLIARLDWTQSPLGPRAQWPGSLDTVLRLMLSSRYAMWLGWGRELTFFCNDTYRDQTLGAKYPWAVGRSAREVWAEIWDIIGPRIEHVLTTGEATYDEGLLLFLERSGYPEETYHSFSYSAAPGDAAGEIGGLFCVVVEETERVIGERRIAFLAELGSQLSGVTTTRAVFSAFEACLGQGAPDLPFALVYAIDHEHARATRMSALGIAEAEAVPQTIALDDPAAFWPIASMVAQRAPVLVELDPARAWPTGPWKSKPHHALLLPVASSTGESSRPVAVLIAGLNPHRPNDDKAREFLSLVAGQLAAGLSTAGAYEAERKRAEALAEIDRAKTAFFSNVSHEFRTPLTLMLAPLEEMRAQPTQDEAVRERFELLHRNAIRLLKLVNTLLDFSRIEAGRVEAMYTPTDLAAFTADIASNFRSAIERAGMIFSVECEQLPELVYVDRDMWEKIVLNLLSNALKFTFEGGISVRLRAEDGEAVLRVEDTGIGIAADELPRMFERFHRIEGARARSHEGSGIGLALVHELVRLSGGRIDVTSGLGKGTTFTVRLRMGSAHLRDDRVSAGRSLQPTAAAADAYVHEAFRWISPDASQAAKGGDGSLRAVAPRRIVVADDNADMREYIARVLREHWVVEAVSNGKAALAAVRREPADLVVTDVMMPELDGFGLLAALRADSALRTIPVILLSARAGEEATAEGLQAGADDYIVKPFTARDLVTRVTARLISSMVRDEERRRLQTLLAQVPAIVNFLRGPDLVFEFVHPKAIDLMGRRPVLGLPLHEAVPEVSEQPFYAHLRRVYETGEPFTQQEMPAFHVIDGQRKESYWNSVYLPVRDATGRIEGVMTFDIDVTATILSRNALERAQAELEVTNARLVEANRSKDEFLAMLGHELRNPLAPIATAAHLLKLRSPDGLEREVGVIERQTQHIARLVDDLLDVSRIARGKVTLQKQPLELAELVAAAIEIASPLIENHLHSVILKVPKHGLVVDVDRGRMTQVLSNLLTNAAKYTPVGGRITVTAARDGADVVVSVHDTGTGISAELLPHVFDMFVQGRQTLDRARGGLGLGLTLVRNLTEMHGGAVFAQSDGPGRGSTFSVRLPASVARASLAGEAAAGPAPVGEAVRLQAHRILVVDDNVDAAEMLAAVLERLGYRTAVAHDGPEALSIAAELVPQLALLDIGLPVMDGYELAARLRTQWGSALSLVAVTGYGQESDRARAREVGFQAHLTKPVDIQALSQLVAKLTGDGASAQ